MEIPFFKTANKVWYGHDNGAANNKQSILKHVSIFFKHVSINFVLIVFFYNIKNNLNSVVRVSNSEHANNV